MAHPPVVRLRDARADELPALLALASHPDVEPFLSGVTEPRLRAAVDDPLQRVLCIEADGTPAGMLRLDLTRWERHRFAEIHTMLIDPALRGRGVGVAALRTLLADLGAHRVQAEAYGFNVAAKRAFEAAGFVHEGTRRAAWWRHDAWQDGILLGWIAP